MCYSKLMLATLNTDNTLNRLHIYGDHSVDIERIISETRSWEFLLIHVLQLITRAGDTLDLQE